MNISQDIIRNLNLSANLIRNDVLDMLKLAGSGHLGGSFSAAEILSVLFNEIVSFYLKDTAILVYTQFYAKKDFSQKTNTKS